MICPILTPPHLVPYPPLPPFLFFCCIPLSSLALCSRRVWGCRQWIPEKAASLERGGKRRRRRGKNTPRGPRLLISLRSASKQLPNPLLQAGLGRELRRGDNNVSVISLGHVGSCKPQIPLTSLAKSVRTDPGRQERRCLLRGLWSVCFPSTTTTLNQRAKG